MAQDEKQLPEGTDKVIAGASATASGDRTVTADTTLVTKQPTAVPKGSGTNSQASGDSGRVMDKLRTGSEKISGQAADKARDFVGQGIERSSEALTSVARLVSDTAGGIDDRLGSEYGDYARQAGEAIDRAAQRLAAKDADEIIDDTREFVRKSPGVALAGAAIIGFALARLVKTGLDSARGDSGGRGNDRS